jgi:hypothetical protein
MNKLHFDWMTAIAGTGFASFWFGLAHEIIGR